MNCVRGCVPFGQEPGAAGNVVPPFNLKARLSFTIEDVIGPLIVGDCGLIWQLAKCATKVEFLDRPRAVDGAGEYFHGDQCPTEAAPFSPTS